ncbi:MAG: MFS transporter, partial [Pseudomonadales bacterium]|nr:MFS transporter [Pseudomonadales bacterium]
MNTREMETASTKERFSWAMYDFANSGYTTVVLTTVFNAYFVGVIASGAGMSSGAATFLWTLAIAAGNAIVLLSAPVVGAIADYRASKKLFLMVTTVFCVVATAMLGLADAGDVAMVTALVILSFVMFGSGEYLISAFLPEIISSTPMGRLSGLPRVSDISVVSCPWTYAWAGIPGH